MLHYWDARKWLKEEMANWELAKYHHIKRKFKFLINSKISVLLMKGGRGENESNGDIILYMNVYTYTKSLLTIVFNSS